MKIGVYVTLSFCITLAACSKDWLSVPSDKSKFIPSTLEDVQALLYNEIRLNTRAGIIEDGGSDDYFLPFSSWSSMTDENKNLYIWNTDIFAGKASPDWNNRYQKVFIANTALDILQQIAITADNQAVHDQLRGESLFFRAGGFYQIASGFAPPYTPDNPAAKPGIPLRLAADLNIPSVRNNLQETYDRIIADLQTAAELLPAQSDFPTRPSRIAAYGLLARVYLSMQDYDHAFQYANLYLSINDELIDYNTLTATASYPLSQMNKEVIFQERTLIPAWLSTSRCRLDSTLIKSYLPNDLRKTVFFKGTAPDNMTFKGSYDGTTYPFTGIATDEQWLIRAECYARNGNMEAAKADLDALLSKRFVTNQYIPLQLTTPQALLTTILIERRKELVFRNLRWIDLRRLNQDDRFKKTLTRSLDGQTYTLSPNSNRYVLPIPDDVIALTGMAQNNRE